MGDGHPAAKPLYVQIKDYILTNIHAGTFAPGTRIPSERALSRQFNVSRLTVSKAIGELVQEGLLFAAIGKGTYVTDGLIDEELDTLTSFTEAMAKRGQQASSRVLACSIEPASETVAGMLNILPGVEVAVLQRVRLADAQPMAIETSNLIASLCPDLFENHDFSRESLYTVLRHHYRLYPTHAEQTIEARRANENEAAALDIETGSPVLAITRITYTTNDKPIEFVRSAYRGDRYKFRALLRKFD